MVETFPNYVILEKLYGNMQIIHEDPFQRTRGKVLRRERTIEKRCYGGWRRVEKSGEDPVLFRNIFTVEENSGNSENRKIVK